MKLCIVKLTAMGDIIHTMVVLEFIKKQREDIQIHWVVEEMFKEVLENNSNIDKILTINLKSLKKKKSLIFSEYAKIKEYAKHNYDLVIDAQGLVKSAIVSSLLGKNIAGFAKDSIRESLASYFYNIKVSIGYEKNVIDRNAYLFSKVLGINITKNDILNKESFLYFKSNLSLDSFLSKEKKNILLIIGASWSSKMYPTERFSNIISMLDANFIVAWGSESEKQSAKSIKKAMLLPKLNLDELKMVISKVDLVIGNDTGPTHMAWALNVASITLFGNTPSYRNTYETKINKTIQSSSKVDPLKLDKNDFSIQNIDEYSIVDIAKELLCIEK